MSSIYCVDCFVIYFTKMNIFAASFDLETKICLCTLCYYFSMIIIHIKKNKRKKLEIVFFILLDGSKSLL